MFGLFLNGAVIGTLTYALMKPDLSLDLKVIYVVAMLANGWAMLRALV